MIKIHDEETFWYFTGLYIGKGRKVETVVLSDSQVSKCLFLELRGIIPVNIIRYIETMIDKNRIGGRKVYRADGIITGRGGSFVGYEHCIFDTRGTEICIIWDTYGVQIDSIKSLIGNKNISIDNHKHILAGYIDSKFKCITERGKKLIRSSFVDAQAAQDFLEYMLEVTGENISCMISTVQQKYKRLSIWKKDASNLVGIFGRMKINDFNLDLLGLDKTKVNTKQNPSVSKKIVVGEITEIKDAVPLIGTSPKSFAPVHSKFDEPIKKDDPYLRIRTRWAEENLKFGVVDKKGIVINREKLDELEAKREPIRRMMKVGMPLEELK